jgi:hypothetical protein
MHTFRVIDPEFRIIAFGVAIAALTEALLNPPGP